MLTDLPPEVAAWRDAIQRLSPVVPPCRYLSAARWGEMRLVCLDFIDRFGAEAHWLGWSAPELFGVHPDHGTLRIDWCGSLMIGPSKVTAIDESRVVFSGSADRRDKPGQPRGMPIWEHAACLRAAA